MSTGYGHGWGVPRIVNRRTKKFIGGPRAAGRGLVELCAGLTGIALMAAAPGDAQAQKPHWCPGNSSPTENAICNDPPSAGGLGQKDLILSSIYQALNPGTNAALRAEQQRWLATRNTVSDVGLLHVLYDYRIGKLRAMLIGDSTPQCAADSAVATVAKPATNFGAGPIPIFVAPSAPTPAFNIATGVLVNVVGGEAAEHVDGSGNSWLNIRCNGTYYWIQKSYIEPL